ncbi:MAG: flagellar hook capping FlgD N-terminal domain-containing protein [Candidatus Sericytochromatia bacterium]
MSSLVGNISDLIGAANDPEKQKRKVGGELDKDAFLQLLVAQLKHQDPMKPMDDTAFIAEMAQFSSLEQMQNLNKLLEKQMGFQALTQASSMIGKHVTLQEPGENGQIITGRVDEIRSGGGEVRVVIDGKEYNASDIMRVADQPAESDGGTEEAQT